MVYSKKHIHFPVVWPKWLHIIFKVCIIWFFLLSIPFYAGWYQDLFANAGNASLLTWVFNLFYLKPGVGYTSAIGWHSLLGWVWALVISVIVAFIWQFKYADRWNISKIYFWFRVVLRYRLAVGILLYGILLIYPLFIPPLTLSDYHTAYGDFAPWKIYFHSTAIAKAGYLQFIGFLLIAASVLLVYRKTVIAGAAIASFILLNVVLVNFAYEIGHQLYSLYLLLLTFALIAHDLPKLYRFLVLGKRVTVEKYRYPSGALVQRLRIFGKFAFGIIAVLFFTIAATTHASSRWPYPEENGWLLATGFYDVSSFKWNDTLLPYSKTDSIRWQDVVIEKWNEVSVRVNKPIHYNRHNQHIDINKSANNYSVKGNGGRLFYNYQPPDKQINTIVWRNETDTTEYWNLTVEQAVQGQIRIKGNDNNGNLVEATLIKVNKEYLLDKGRKQPISIY